MMRGRLRALAGLAHFLVVLAAVGASGNTDVDGTVAGLKAEAPGCTYNLYAMVRVVCI